MFDDLYNRLRGIDTETTDDTAEPDYDAFRVTKWKLGDHGMKPSTDPQELYTDAVRNEGINDELSRLLESAAARLEDVSVYDFECPVCGLGHGHSDTKHDIRKEFNVTPEFAEGMRFDPYCHCGVNELAVLADFVDLFEVPMFTDEDDLTESELDARYDEIRRAASNARVSDAVENTLETLRESLRQLAEDDLPSPVDDEDDTGDFRF